MKPGQNRRVDAKAVVVDAADSAAAGVVAAVHDAIPAGNSRFLRSIEKPGVEKTEAGLPTLDPWLCTKHELEQFGTERRREWNFGTWDSIRN
jgi:hypothetical protein